MFRRVGAEVVRFLSCGDHEDSSFAGRIVASV